MNINPEGTSLQYDMDVDLVEVDNSIYVICTYEYHLQGIKFYLKY